MEIAHRWHSSPSWLEGSASVVLGLAVLVAGVVDVVRTDVSGVSAAAFVVLLFALPAVGLVEASRRAAGSRRSGRPPVSPGGPTVVDESEEREPIAREDLREIDGGEGLERGHPGLRTFEAGDMDIGLIVWMLGCMVWTFVVIGLAHIQAL